MEPTPSWPLPAGARLSCRAGAGTGTRRSPGLSAPGTPASAQTRVHCGRHTRVPKRGQQGVRWRWCPGHRRAPQERLVGKTRRGRRRDLVCHAGRRSGQHQGLDTDRTQSRDNGQDTHSRTGRRVRAWGWRGEAQVAPPPSWPASAQPRVRPARLCPQALPPRCWGHPGSSWLPMPSGSGPDPLETPTASAPETPSPVPNCRGPGQPSRVLGLCRLPAPPATCPPITHPGRRPPRPAATSACLCPGLPRFPLLWVHCPRALRRLTVSTESGDTPCPLEPPPRPRGPPSCWPPLHRRP